MTHALYGKRLRWVKSDRDSAKHRTTGHNANEHTRHINIKAKGCSASDFTFGIDSGKGSAYDLAFIDIFEFNILRERTFCGPGGKGAITELFAAWSMDNDGLFCPAFFFTDAPLLCGSLNQHFTQHGPCLPQGFPEGLDAGAGARDLLAKKGIRVCDIRRGPFSP